MRAIQYLDDFTYEVVSRKRSYNHSKSRHNHPSGTSRRVLLGSWGLSPAMAEDAFADVAGDRV